MGGAEAGRGRAGRGWGVGGGEEEGCWQQKVVVSRHFEHILNRGDNHRLLSFSKLSWQLNLYSTL